MNRYGNICHKDQKEEIREENNGVGDGGAVRDGKDINVLYSGNLPNLKLMK